MMITRAHSLRSGSPKAVMRQVSSQCTPAFPLVSSCTVSHDNHAVAATITEMPELFSGLLYICGWYGACSCTCAE